jgi:hypothetical protein
MAGQLTIDTLKASSGVLATQNGMTGIAKAWAICAYNGGSAVTLTSSFNISSLTRNSAGNYTFNFTTAMPSANYVASVSPTQSGSNNIVAYPTTYTTSAVTVTEGYGGTGAGVLTAFDYGLNIAVFSS